MKGATVFLMILGFGLSAGAEILFHGSGVQLQRTARIVSRNVATYEVIENRQSADLCAKFLVNGGFHPDRERRVT